MIVRRSVNNPTRTFDIAKNYISKSIQNISLKLKTEDGERGNKNTIHLRFRRNYPIGRNHQRPSASRKNPHGKAEK